MRVEGCLYLAEIERRTFQVMVLINFFNVSRNKAASVWQLRGKKEELLGLDGFQSPHPGSGK